MDSPSTSGQVTSSNSHVVVGIAILAVVLLISPVIIVLVRMVTRTLQVSVVISEYVICRQQKSSRQQQ